MKNKKSEVYYIPLDSTSAHDRSVFSLECVLTHKVLHFFDFFNSNDVVGLKINSSTKKNVRYHNHEYAALVSKLLQIRGISSFICDTTSKYINRAESASKHMDHMFRKGFSYQNTKTPFIMLDGANGNSEITIESNRNEFIHLAGEVGNLDGIVFLSSAFYHNLVGFEGALFNMGFGLSSKRGKIIHHSTSSPRVDSSRCFYCRKCLHACPVGAIYVSGRHVEIDSNICIDCGKCVEIALYGGIVYDWDATPDYFQNQLIKYSKCVKHKLKNKQFFCNFLPSNPSDSNTKELNFCGILISRDPLAIDVATNDLLKQKLPNKIDLTSLFEAAVKNKIGNIDYKLITVNY